LGASALGGAGRKRGGGGFSPRPADLGQIIADTLDGLGPQGRPVLTDIPSGLPQVIADPQITERVIVNLLSNAMRYSPPMSPPLLTARACGGRVELRVTDHGPGIPQALRQRAFLPFCRLPHPATPPRTPPPPPASPTPP